MSYCRFREGVSDVYMYGGEEGIVCCFCWLFPESQTFTTPQAALEHLQAHRDAGHIVPDYAFEELRDEITETLGDDKTSV